MTHKNHFASDMRDHSTRLANGWISLGRVTSLCPPILLLVYIYSQPRRDWTIIENLTSQWASDIAQSREVQGEQLRWLNTKRDTKVTARKLTPMVVVPPRNIGKVAMGVLMNIAIPNHAYVSLSHGCSTLNRVFNLAQGLYGSEFLDPV